MELNPIVSQYDGMIEDLQTNSEIRRLQAELLKTKMLLQETTSQIESDSNEEEEDEEYIDLGDPYNPFYEDEEEQQETPPVSTEEELASEILEDSDDSFFLQSVKDIKSIKPAEAPATFKASLEPTDTNLSADVAAFKMAAAKHGTKNASPKVIALGNFLQSKVKDFVATSIFRDNKQQEKILKSGRGAKHSHHLTGNAIDARKSPALLKYINENQEEIERQGFRPIIESDHVHFEPILQMGGYADSYQDARPDIHTRELEPVTVRAVRKKQMANGGMIKRKDGSYSKRGLWDNIRANRGSGKKPTKEMLAQERKIKSKQIGGEIPIAKNVTEQYAGLNNPNFDQMYFPNTGFNKFRGLDNKEPVYIVDALGNEFVLHGPDDIAITYGDVYEKRM